MTAPPDTLPVDVDGIPAELVDLPRWVLWSWERRGDQWTKPPRQPSGASASVTDPSTWSKFSEVIDAYEAGDWAGLGFVLVDDDDLTGVDLDHAVTDDGVASWAAEIVDKLDSYTEVSPSGTGLHVIARGRLPRTGRRRGSVEMYETERYLTITGRANGRHKIHERTDELAEVHSEHVATCDDGPDLGGASLDELSAVSDLSDDEVLDRARSARNCDKFERLWSGSNDDHDGDASRGDAALVAMLALWTRDVDQIDRLFRSSGRMRDKWAKRPDYRERTIRYALGRRADDAAQLPDSVELVGSGSRSSRRTTTDSSEFWAARPLLDHVQSFARARMAPPWATLGALLARAAVAVPPSVTLPPIVGVAASLNLYVAAVGPSGSGKGAASGVAGEAVELGDPWTVGLGSGEGFLAQYVEYQPGDKRSGRPGQLVQLRDSVLWTCPEVDSLEALGSRNGSTLGGVLRSVYSGESLGFGYRKQDTRLRLEAHAYRAALVVGVQPGKGAVLLDDADAGTPQRFLWLPATDPDAPDLDDLPSAGEPLPCPLPERFARWATEGGRDAGPFLVSGGVPDPYEPVDLDVPAAVVREVRELHQARQRGEYEAGGALDGHTMLTRLKVAGLLGLLDGRESIDAEDWQLAGEVMAISVETRDRVADHLADQSAERDKARGRAQARTEESREDAFTARCARRILTLLDERPEWSHKELRGRLSAGQREHLGPAAASLVSGGLLEIDESAGGGTVYRRGGGAK